MELFLLTLSLGGVDGLNPFAIIQQFMIQPMTKKKHHIWYYIGAIYLTNFVIGILFLFGALKHLSKLYNYAFTEYHSVLMVLILIASGAILVLTLKHLFLSKKEDDEELKISKKKFEVTPKKLFVLGFFSTLVEVATAAPYFAFLTMIFQTNVHSSSLVLLMIIYNFMYALPLIILAILFFVSQKKFESAFLFMKDKLFKVGGLIIQIVLIVIAIYGIYYAIVAI